jgi:hypothetical protein
VKGIDWPSSQHVEEPYYHLIVKSDSVRVLDVSKTNSTLTDSLVCVITNFDFNENAMNLKSTLSKRWKTFLVDSSSPETPEGADYVIPNEYYPGLLKKAISIATEGDFDWILFIASDVEIPDYFNFQNCIEQIIGEKKVGVYSPTVTEDSRCAYANLFNQSSGKVREVGLIEGFIFLTQVKLLDSLSEPLKNSKYGWCLDVLLCYNAYKSGKVVIADDRSTVYHPKSISPVNSIFAKLEANEKIPRKVFEWANFAERFQTKYFKFQTDLHPFQEILAPWVLETKVASFKLRNRLKNAWGMWNSFRRNYLKNER